MMIFLCIYLIIGLIITTLLYIESYEEIMRALKQVRKATILEKFLLIMIFIVSTLVLTLAWPVLVAMMIL